jgi:hypothetical protein
MGKNFLGTSAPVAKVCQLDQTKSTYRKERRETFPGDQCSCFGICRRYFPIGNFFFKKKKIPRSQRKAFENLKNNPKNNKIK